MTKKKAKVKKVRVVKVEKLEEDLHAIDLSLVVEGADFPVDPLPAEPIELYHEEATEKPKGAWARFFQSLGF